MIRGTRMGSVPSALSILNNAASGVGHAGAQAVEALAAMAELADRRSFTRFWLSEHHGMPGAITGSPAVTLARLTAHTANLRLGAGGVMLPNHAPLSVAEDYYMLEAMAPGRIDLGLGRAPGTDGMTAAALRRNHASNDEFPQQVMELLAFLDDDFPDNHPFGTVHAVPGPWHARQNRLSTLPAPPEVWFLGSSDYSARLAAKLGRPYAFAHQFGGDAAAQVFEIYRDNFEPSEVLSEPYTLMSVGVAAAETTDTAYDQAVTAGNGMLRMFQGLNYLYETPEDVRSNNLTPREQMVLEEWTARTVHGTADTVATQLEQMQRQLGIDELMLLPQGHSLDGQLRTVELLSDVWDLPTDGRRGWEDSAR